MSEARVDSRASHGAPPANRGARSGGSLLSLPPWTRAPRLALRTPAVIVAVIIASAILACASASASLFVSSATSEALRLNMGQFCPTASYPAIKSQVDYTKLPTEDDGTIDFSKASGIIAKLAPQATKVAELRDAMRAHGLAAPELFAHSGNIMPSGTNKIAVNLLYGDHALQNVTITEKSDLPGFYVPQTVAKYMGVHAGDTIQLSNESITVAGVYQNLFGQPIRPYWCIDRALFDNAASASTPPPDILIATSEALYFDKASPSSFARLTSPVDRADSSLSDAHDWQDAVDAVLSTTAAAKNPLNGIAADSNLEDSIKDVTLVRAGLVGPIVPIAIGGSMLALFLVGAAGSYWADRRFNEVRMLASRGVGAGGLALKAGLELIIPAAVGTILGLGAAYFIVRALGPSSVFDRNALPYAGLTAAFGFILGILVMAMVAGIRGRGHVEKTLGRKRTIWSMLPWELLLLVAAGACWWALDSGGAVTVDRKIPVLSVLVLAFPLLFLVGASAFVVRLLILVLPVARKLGGRAGTALFLAVSRISASKVISGVVLAALAMPVAMTLYAAGLTDSIKHTLDAKGHVYVGAETAVQTVGTIKPGSKAAGLGTVVDRYEYIKVDGENAELLTIDPKTFAANAYWDDSFADASLPQLVDKLTAPAKNGVIPAIVVRAPGATSITLGDDNTKIAITVIDAPKAFPGIHQNAPLVIVARGQLPDIPQSAGLKQELWTPVDVNVAQKAFAAQELPIYNAFTPDSVLDVANVLSISWTFDYLQALAALSGVIAIGGLLLYVETRSRTRIASYAMARRMGLRRSTHFQSLLIEFAVLVGFAALCGAALSYVAARIVNPMLELSPLRPPAPIFTAPTGALLLTAGVAIIIAVGTALYAQSAADRAKLSEVLRLGD
ncbi:FtsX-like permease family protein [Antricoccus suffuscus]|uniref:FtsX-like permease family protein n=1 Tax=Antricoccus suffuscus TaxID=1629062 RepID=UPI00147445FB|nr:ABC transporter permease [Antricoccus suffuscus]